MSIEQPVEPGPTLAEYARAELEKAGLFDRDSDYEGMIGRAVQELIEKFAGQGHSGFSAEITLQAFERVARRRSLALPTKGWSELVEDAEFRRRGLDRLGGLFMGAGIALVVLGARRDLRPR